MEEKSRQSFTGSVEKSKGSRLPGMQEGAGDGASAVASPPHPMAMGNSDAEDLASLEACLAGLNISSETYHASKKQASEEWASDNDLLTDDEDGSEMDIQCSYPFGYLKRQTVYTCLTCSDPTAKDWKPAGICIGCRTACHHGHEVISLETRRNFRCDCGNKKFSQETSCVLYPDKDDTNDLNQYNGNFKGTFCSCDCKETDCIVEDPLYQCVVCEDWYHASHCNASTEGIEKNYTDLVCGGCTSKLDFLRYYEPFNPKVTVDENAIDEMMQYTDGDSGDEDEKPEQVIDESLCKLKTLVKKPSYNAGCLWTLGWRGKLCRCTKCKEMYASLNVSFLLDRDDEVRRYFTTSDDDEDGRFRICSAVMKFEQWLFKMNSEERELLFNSGPEVVKAKMKEYFQQTKEEDEEDLAIDDEMLDQLFMAFKEYILDAEGGSEYLDDLDVLATLPSKLLKDCSPGGKGEASGVSHAKSGGGGGDV